LAGQAAEFRLETGQGDDGAFLPGVGKAKDEIEIWHKEVNRGYPKHQPVVPRPTGRQ